MSSRCKRWVNCWLTQVAVLHRCDPDGSNIRALSSNNEHDKLPPEDLAAQLECHEPRPLAPRLREPVIQPRVKPEEAAGRFLLADVNHGRNMTGVEPGDIKKLLVLETLPMPVHFTGGMEPISYGGTFTLERILGTVPVEQDGSAYFEVPAMRSVFFVALDASDMAVKRMQSFTSLQPGELQSCVGCHEHRSQTPRADFHTTLAVRKPPARLEPIRDVPEIIDFPRDIQPVLNALCTDCHGYEKTSRGGPRAGRLLLTGDRGPIYSHSYYMLTIARLFADGRNQPKSNYQPRALGSSASRLLTLLDGSHHEVRATPHQKKLLRLWIESAAAYPGTDEREVSFWQPSLDDPRLLTSRHLVFNLTRPEQSLLLLAPLAESAGGWGLCRDLKTRAPANVFAQTSDPDYQKLLGLVVAGKEFLDHHARFDMCGFKPRTDWVREMKRYGVLLEGVKPEEVMDVYAVEQDYWKSLWHQPVPAAETARTQNP